MIPVVAATKLQAVNKRKYAKFEVIISLLMCTDRVLFGQVVAFAFTVAQLLHCLMCGVSLNIRTPDHFEPLLLQKDRGEKW